MANRNPFIPQSDSRIVRIRLNLYAVVVPEPAASPVSGEKWD
ncbi:MAG: hypothetical protein OXO50_01595 [Caldilineaceae bacterium]|nr:hypothetical protein [Caldilineaceae bacterium]